MRICVPVDWFVIRSIEGRYLPTVSPPGLCATWMNGASRDADVAARFRPKLD